MSSQILVEVMESRLLMSAAPSVFNTAVKADRLVVRAELLKFKSDVLLSQAQLERDLLSIRKNVAAGDTSLIAPFATLKSDNKALGLTLRIDRLNEAANALADESVIKRDIAQILKDKGNTTAVDADRAKLRTDRITLQNDLIAGLDTRIAARQSYETTIANDTQAIVTAANNDPNASAALKAVASNFATDRNTRLTTLTNDLQNVQTARTQLVNDLTALQSA